MGENFYMLFVGENILRWPLKKVFLMTFLCAEGVQIREMKRRSIVNVAHVDVKRLIKLGL